MVFSEHLIKITLKAVAMRNDFVQHEQWQQHPKYLTERK